MKILSVNSIEKCADRSVVPTVKKNVIIELSTRYSPYSLDLPIEASQIFLIVLKDLDEHTVVVSASRMSFLIACLCRV